MLTGFRFQVGQHAVLDKIIDYENIIQAFSRTNRLFGPRQAFRNYSLLPQAHTMKGYIEAAVKTVFGDKAARSVRAETCRKTCA